MRRNSAWLVAVLCWFCGATGFAETAPPMVDQEFDLVTPPRGFLDLKDICAGPDGNLWFTENGAAKIGRITPQGVITEFPVGGKTYGICAGVDGNVWFTEAYGPTGNVGKIGQMDVHGVLLNEYAAGSRLTRIACAPTGVLYFGMGTVSAIGKMTAKGEYSRLELGGSSLALPIENLCVGPDGNIWFPCQARSTVGILHSLDETLSFVQIADSVGMTSVLSGIGGVVWVADTNGAKSFFRTVSSAGAVTVSAWPGSLGAFKCMALGEDWNLWGSIGTNRIDSYPASALGPSLPLTSRATSFAVTAVCRGPDAAMWMTESAAGGSKIGRASIAIPALPTLTATAQFAGSYSPPRYYTWSAGTRQALTAALSEVLAPQSRVHRTRVLGWSAVAQDFYEISAATRANIHLGDAIYLTTAFDFELPVSSGMVERAPFSVTLHPGWNFIGIPNLADGPGPVLSMHPLSAFTLYDDAHLAIGGSSRAAAIGSSVYRWNGAAYEVATALETGQGYWIKNSTAKTLTLTRVNTETGGAVVSGVEERGEGQMEIEHPPFLRETQAQPVTSCGAGTMLGMLGALSFSLRRQRRVARSTFSE